MNRLRHCILVLLLAGGILSGLTGVGANIVVFVLILSAANIAVFVSDNPSEPAFISINFSLTYSAIS